MNTITFTTTEFTEFVTRKEVSCKKCDGKGRIYAYRHIDGGRCFKCGGSGNNGTTTETEEIEGTTTTHNAIILEDGMDFEALAAKYAAKKNKPIDNFNIFDWFEDTTAWYED